MMTNRLEDLWNSADDGASSPIGPFELRTDDAFDSLLDAWFLERRNSIEFEILLDESKKLIRRMLEETKVPVASARRARRLIRAIDETLRSAETRDS